MLTEIGERVFNILLLGSVITTFLSLSFIAGGVDPSVINMPLFLGVKPFADMTMKMAQSLPSNSTSVNVFLGLASAVLAGGLVQFLLMVLGFFPLLVATLAQMTPPELHFLIPAGYFVASFLQFTSWVYLLDRLRSLLPVTA